MDFQNTKNLRLQQMPVLHVRGTHREVGFAIGRTFKNFIHDVIKTYDFVENLLIPIYNTLQGEKLFNSTLQLCKTKFPGYVEELEGIALGCEIPFHKLFLLHIEMLIIPSKEEKFHDEKSETGCTCILTYPDKDTVLLGHTEDARRGLKNNLFILNAEILNDAGEKLEKFSTLCYSCCLPGYTMGYNEHGVFHSMDSLVPSHICPDKTPTSFLMRALLGATSLNHAIDVLRDYGTGTADGFSVNFIYAPPGVIPVLQNVEVAPNPEYLESKLDIQNVGIGESYTHCNKYIRLPVAQEMHRLTWSEERHITVDKYSEVSPFDMNSIKVILSDRTNEEYPIFRVESEKDLGAAATVAVGIFDILNRKWSIYTHPPETHPPVVVLPIELNEPVIFY